MARVNSRPPCSPDASGVAGGLSAAPVSEDFELLLARVRACTVCAPHLPFGPRPVLRGRPSARLLIVSQAPGARVHDSGFSFDDRSGDRLREWLAVDRDTFYDETRVAIIPIGLCYPGRDAKGGDLPPRRECAPLWQERLRAAFPAIGLTVLVGHYAIAHHLNGSRRRPMTEMIARWRDFLPAYFLLPHPSWHTIAWVRNNPWFEREALPELRTRLRELLDPLPIDRRPIDRGPIDQGPIA